MIDLDEIIKQIETLEHNRTVICLKCLTKNSVQSLEFYAKCSNCQTKTKIRGMSTIMELEDVITTSLVWLIRDEKFGEIVEKYKKLLAEEDN